MNNTVRNILGIILGVVVGAIVNMGLVLLASMIAVPAAGVDTTTVEGMRQGMHLLEPQHFAGPFLAHALGTFAGALVAYFAVASHRQWAVYSVGVFYLLGGIAASTMIPAPVWFVVLDLVVAYIPMAWLAMKLGSNRFQSVDRLGNSRRTTRAVGLWW